MQTKHCSSYNFSREAGISNFYEKFPDFQSTVQLNKAILQARYGQWMPHCHRRLYIYIYIYIYIYKLLFHIILFFFCLFHIILMGFSGGSDGRASACNAGDPGSIPGSRRSPGEGNGYLL